VFFFQAEDGIRDKLVTGVQTCALPIFSRAVGDLPKRSHSSTFGGNPLACAAAIAAIGEMRRLELAACARDRGALLLDGLRAIRRSEERRVGKEARRGRQSYAC